MLLKSDGIPTYHFAHAVDDHLMGTTHVIRGEEWLPSLAKHLMLFRYLGFRLPKYMHIAQIMRLDPNGTWAPIWTITAVWDMHPPAFANIS